MSAETEQNAAGAKMLALAERCEKATGPDRGLDRAIQLAVRKPVPSDKWTGRDTIPLQKPRYFTASLDAAMTLVPHPAWVRMDQWPMDFCHGPVVSVQPIRKPQVDLHAATGSTLPLALCAAALRAKAQ